MATSERVSKCDVCGEPMPPNEQMFRVHGYSGPCPKPPLPTPPPARGEEGTRCPVCFGDERCNPSTLCGFPDTPTPEANDV